MLVWRGRGAAPSGNGSWRRQGARSLPICASLLLLVLLARAAEPSVADEIYPCDIGYYAALVWFHGGGMELTGCVRCPKNTYMDEETDVNYTKCWSVDGYLHDSCVEDKVCKNCPDYAFTSELGSTSLSDCWCGDGFVGELGVHHTECKNCLGIDGVSCTGNNFTVESGYYKPPGSYEVFECYPPSACKGGPDLRWDSETECKEGNSGPKCAVCEDGYYSVGASGCIKCGSKEGALAATGGLVLGVILLYWAIFRCVVLSTLKALSLSLSLSLFVHFL